MNSSVVQVPKRIRWDWIALAGVLALLAGCAAPRLAYPRMDWLASWKLGQYVDLDDAQQKRFDAAFSEIWSWHRTSELAAYETDLRTLAEASQKPVGVDTLQDWAVKAEAHSHRLLERALPPSCEVMATFSDAQRDSVLKRVDHDIEEDVEKYLEPSEAQRRKDAQKRLRKSLERWIGKLNAEQNEMVVTWSAERPQRYEAWIAERKRWRDRFAGVLDARATLAFCDSLKGLFLQQGSDSDDDLVNESNRQMWLQFLAQVSATLDARQREHLSDKLLELAADLDHLQQPS